MVERLRLFAALAIVALSAGAAGDEPLIVTLKIGGDRAIEVADGPKDASRAIIYLHGLCGNPLAFRSWAAAAERHGTLISLRGDESCPGSPGRSKWSFDLDKNNRRVSAAIARASAWRAAKGEKALDAEHVVLVGYSQGARRAEFMAGRFFQRFSRVAIIAEATAPEPARLLHVGRVLVMAGELDLKKHLIDGEQALEKAGITASYIELPRARHGDYGPQALRVMGEGLDWLFKDVP